MTLSPSRACFQSYMNHSVRPRTRQKNPCFSGEREDDKRSDRTGPRSSDCKPEGTICNLAFVLFRFCVCFVAFSIWHFQMVSWAAKYQQDNPDLSICLVRIFSMQLLHVRKLERDTEQHNLSITHVIIRVKGKQKERDTSGPLRESAWIRGFQKTKSLQ